MQFTLLVIQKDVAMRRNSKAGYPSLTAAERTHKQTSTQALTSAKHDIVKARTFLRNDESLEDEADLLRFVF